MELKPFSTGLSDPSEISGWICPSHPETLWDEPGDCPRCRIPMEHGSLSAKMAKEPKLDFVRRRFIGFGLTVMSALIGWSFGLRGETLAQMSRGMMGGHGMMGDGCPMCGQRWKNIPAKLPTPKSQTWLQNLKDILSLERLSLVQYQADENKYQVHMPYMMVEDLHIKWISELFAAYGLSSAGPTPAVRKSNTIAQAYEIALKLEEELIPRYEQLISTAEDPDSAGVLRPILHQTRMHYMMFSHALRMGGRMGPGMEHPGMMQRGR